jgi:hypothetical protein
LIALQHYINYCPCIHPFTLSSTDVNHSEVWGNIVTLNTYGDPVARATWHCGASYLWHDIDGHPVDIMDTEPIIKAGMLFNAPALHLSINLYLGHGWQQTETTLSMPGQSRCKNENSESVI